MLLSIMLALATPLAAGPDAVQDTTPPSLFQPGEPLAARTDTTRIAVRTTLDAATITATMSEWLDVDVTMIEPLGLPDWHFIELPAADRTQQGVEQAVKTLCTIDALDFVSPVYLDSGNRPGLPSSTMLVKFNENLSPAEAALELSAFPVVPVTTRPWPALPSVYKVTCTTRSGLDVLALASDMANQPGIAFAEPDMIFMGRSGGFGYPNDPGFPYCWGLHNNGTYGTVDRDMDCLEAWATTTGDPSIRVLVIDTGVEQTHADINQIPGVDFTSAPGIDGGPVNDCDNHGTPVAGCVSAIVNNGVYMAGSAPGCLSVSARCFISSLDCSGGWWSQWSWTVDALDFALAQGIRVTNNSNLYGGWTSTTINEAYAATRAAGIVHFACAGNDGGYLYDYPAALGSVMSISATNSLGNLAAFSNYNHGVAVAAPGQWILSTDRTGPLGYDIHAYAFVDGTSFASPYAAGVAALILSVDPGLSPLEVENILKISAVDSGAPGYDPYFGWGVVNANQALQQVLNPQVLEVCPWGCDFLSIQAAIDAAQNGDQIMVWPGTYTDVGRSVINTKGKQLTIWSTDGPEYTIIDGEGQRRALMCDGGEGEDTVLEGFTFTNGVADDYDFGNGAVWNVGGAVLCSNSASPTLRSCTISKSTAEYGGGFAAAFFARPRLEYCTILDNEATISGGGMLLSAYADVVAEGCYVWMNKATTGGAITVEFDSDPKFFSCTMADNLASDHGGAVYAVENCVLEFTACDVVGNKAEEDGGGMYVQGSSLLLDYCTMSQNTGVSDGGGLFLTTSTTTIVGSLISGNSGESQGGGIFQVASILSLEMSGICDNDPDQIVPFVFNDGGGNVIGPSCDTCEGDTNTDGMVDITDLLHVIASWMTPDGDINGDGNTDIEDLLLVINRWGSCL
ncbi:MAG: S8 family serine peptidase [Phycisphaerales bacterium]|nr:S8 family serine peptidase [Phycisphaerales bacterium]